MLSINMEGRLGEKRAKELITSLEYMLNSVAQVLKDKASQTNELCTFKISYDNGSSLQMMAFTSKGNTYFNMEFSDEHGLPREEICLQEALNLNKYALDIRTQLDSISKSADFTFHAFFTEQSIKRKIPIYAEHNKAERNMTNKTQHSSMRSKNIGRYEEIDI